MEVEELHCICKNWLVFYKHMMNVSKQREEKKKRETMIKWAEMIWKNEKKPSFVWSKGPLQYKEERWENQCICNIFCPQTWCLLDSLSLFLFLLFSQLILGDGITTSTKWQSNHLIIKNNYKFQNILILSLTFV